MQENLWNAQRSFYAEKAFERMERGKEYKRRLSSYFRGINEGDAYDYANTYHASGNGQWKIPLAVQTVIWICLSRQLSSPNIY